MFDDLGINFRYNKDKNNIQKFMNEQVFIVVAEESGRGGLFDIGATLPFVAIQFLILMFALNAILYKPLITLINERNEHILNNLSKAAEMLQNASKLTAQYESALVLTKTEAKHEIIMQQKLQKENFDSELKISQKHIDTMLQTISNDISLKKENKFQFLEIEIDTLSNEIINKLSRQSL